MLGSGAQHSALPLSHYYKEITAIVKGLFGFGGIDDPTGREE